MLKKHEKYQLHQVIFMEDLEKIQEIPPKPANF